MSLKSERKQLVAIMTEIRHKLRLRSAVEIIEDEKRKNVGDNREQRNSQTDTK